MIKVGRWRFEKGLEERKGDEENYEEMEESGRIRRRNIYISKMEEEEKEILWGEENRIIKEIEEKKENMMV